MGKGRTTSKLKKAVTQLVLAARRSLSLLHPQSPRAIIKQETCSLPHHHDEAVAISNSSSTSTILCAICLEPLISSHSISKAVFTGECSHSFHVSCITSNVRHGSVTCPICRAHWTHLPCSSFPNHQLDHPDDSIAALPIHRYSFLRSARYDDDDPINPPHSTSLYLSLTPHPCLLQAAHSPNPQEYHSLCARKAYLSVRLNRQPIDLVLVASPTSPRLGLLKQAMMLVTFSLRPVDRLSIIVTYPCVAARMFSLRRMTSCGKRSALRVIDRIIYIGQTDPSQGILKSIKVLKDRAYKNPRCSILHICASSLIRPSYYPRRVMHMGVTVHMLNVGFGTETWDGFVVMRKLEELLGKVLGGVASDVQLRIGMGGRIVKVGELRGGEEQRVLIDLGAHVNVIPIHLCFSYVEGDVDECVRRRGETTLSFDDCEDACVRTSVGTQTWDR